MSILDKTTIGVPIVAVATVGVVAFSSGSVSAVEHGRDVRDHWSGGCMVSLWYDSSTKTAFGKVTEWTYPWVCRGFVKNDHGAVSRALPVGGSYERQSTWTDGVQRPSGYRAQACVYSYRPSGSYYGWTCTWWY